MQNAVWIERVLRRANEIIAEHLEAVATPPVSGGFVCECTDERCTDPIDLPLVDFRRIQRQRNCFVVAPGHELADLERLVEENDGYVVVHREPVEETTGEANSRFH